MNNCLATCEHQEGFVEDEGLVNNINVATI